MLSSEALTILSAANLGYAASRVISTFMKPTACNAVFRRIVGKTVY